MGQLSQGSRRELPCLFFGKCPQTGIGRVWDAILVTVDGFGGLTCESCRQNLYCHTDPASLGRDPRER